MESTPTAEAPTSLMRIHLERADENGRPSDLGDPRLAARTKARLAQLLLGGTTSLILALITALSGSPAGYELSIYDSVSVFFWVFVGLGYSLFSLGLYLASQLRRGVETGLHLTGLTATNFILLGLPALRYGTIYDQWDVWFSLGYTSEIAVTGRVDLTANFYPGLHLFWFTFSTITGTSIFTVGILLGQYIFATRVPLVYLLTRRCFKSATAAAIAAPLAALPDGVGGTYPVAWIFALALLPLVFFAFALRLEEPGVGSTSLTIVAAAGLVISHPIGPLFLFAALVLYLLWIAGRRVTMVGGEPRRSSKPEQLTIINLTAVLGVIFLIWTAFITTVLAVSLSQITDVITAEGVVSPAQYGSFFTPVLLLRIFGGYAIIGIYWLGGLCVIRSVKSEEKRGGTLLAASVVIGSLIAGVGVEVIAARSLLGGFFNRPQEVGILFAPVLAAPFLGALRSWSRRSTWRRTTIVVAYLTPFVLVVAAMFPSPYVALFNYQNTTETFAPVHWGASFLPENSTTFSSSYVGRYAFYPLQVLGPQYRKLFHFEGNLPSDFSQIANWSDREAYMIVDMETVIVAGANLRAWRFPNLEDMSVLQRIPTVSRIYDNGGAQIYKL